MQTLDAKLYEIQEQVRGLIGYTTGAANLNARSAVFKLSAIRLEVQNLVARTSQEVD